MRTHLSDEGQLQGDIEDDLGVARRQLLGSAWGKAAPSQSPMVEQPLCDRGLQHATWTGCCRAECPGFFLVPLGELPSQEMTAQGESHRHPRAGAAGSWRAGSGWGGGPSGRGSIEGWGRLLSSGRLLGRLCPCCGVVEPGACPLHCRTEGNTSLRVEGLGMASLGKKPWE